MHRMAMKMCRPGVVEREIAGAIESIALQHGAGVSFFSIVSQHGETLHNHCHEGTLLSGLDRRREPVAVRFGNLVVEPRRR